jgi:hypothetical protein
MLKIAAIVIVACACETPPPSPPVDPQPPPIVRADPVAADPQPARPEPDPAQPIAPPPSRPTGDLADCTWYADLRPPELEGPRSLAAFDEALSRELGREAWAVGRVRGRARGCPDVSIGVAIVRDRVADPDDLVGDVYEDDEPIAGERGDERRNEPWDPEAPYDTDDDLCGPPTDGADVVLFRASHGAAGIEHLRTMNLAHDVCRWLHHSVVLGDLDHDGRSEVRVELRSQQATDEASELHAGHRLWIVDVATFQEELAIDLAIYVEQFINGIGGEETTAELTLRDMNGDGHRDALVRGRSSGTIQNVDPEGDGEGTDFRDFFTRVFPYDPIADRFAAPAP